MDCAPILGDCHQSITGYIFMHIYICLLCLDSHCGMDQTMYHDMTMAHMYDHRSITGSLSYPIIFPLYIYIYLSDYCFSKFIIPIIYNPIMLWLFPIIYPVVYISYIILWGFPKMGVPLNPPAIEIRPFMETSHYVIIIFHSISHCLYIPLLLFIYLYIYIFHSLYIPL